MDMREQLYMLEIEKHKINTSIKSMYQTSKRSQIGRMVQAA